MKRVNKYLLTCFVFVAVVMACRDESLEKRPNVSDHVGAVTKIEVNPARNFFNLLNPLASEYVEFTVDVDGFDVTEISNVEVEVVFTEKDRLYDPFQEIFVDSVYAPLTFTIVNTFPSTVQISGQDMADALGFASVADFEVGDTFSATFPINTGDGRRLTVALNSELCNQPGQPSFGGCGVAWGVTCPSDIPEGAYEVFVTDTGATYTVNLTATGGGAYAIDNLNLDYDLNFYGGFNDLPLSAAFSDVCNSLILNGVADFDVSWRGTGTWDAATQTMTFPSITDVAYGQGPWDNGGGGYVLTKL